MSCIRRRPLSLIMKFIFMNDTRMAIMPTTCADQMAE